MLKRFFAILLELKKEIIIFFLIFSIGSVIFALSLDNIYRSSAKIFPDSSETSSLGGISSLVNLAGISNLDNSKEETIAIETLKSREFILYFIKKRALEPYLLAFDDTDGNGNIEFDKNLYNEGVWSKSLLFNGKVSNQELYEALRSNLFIGQDFDTGSYTISVEYRDPKLAYDMLSMIIKDLDTYLRNKELEITKGKLDYLQSNSSTFSTIRQKEYLDSLVYEQLIKLLRIESNDYYSFSLIDKPYYPEEKIKPKRTFIVLFAMMIYSFLIIILATNKNKKS